MSEIIDERHKYLKEEIVDKGFDIEACQGYLVQCKPDGGDDIENWTLVELKNAVETFKLSLQQQIQPQIVEIAEPFQEGCQKCDINELSKGDQKIKILGYKKENAGLFKSSYIVFQIETQPIGWNVQRRYSDFEWLRSALQKLFPGFIIPPIHKKRTKRSFEDPYLKKRVIFLQRFFESLMQSYELRSNQLLKMFLTCQSASDFKNYQEGINKMNNNQSVSKMYTKDGQVNTQASIEIYQYAHQTGEYFNNLDSVYKKIRVLSKGLEEIQLQNSLKIYSIGEIFASLFQSMNKLNQVLPTGQMQGIAATFLNLHNTMITWGNIIAKSIDQTEEFLNSFFKYQQHYNIQIRQLYQNRANLQMELDKFRQKLNYKKEKLHETGDVSKWELSKEFQGNTQDLIQNKKLAFQYMCDNETKCENNMIRLQGYYTNQIHSQTQEYFKNQQIELANHFIKFCQVQTYNITDHHQLWADAISNLQNNLIIQQQQTQQIIIDCN